MSLYGTTNISTSRAKSINEMQARESASRQATRESMAHSTKIIRQARLASIG
jgi:hypothetical protein